MNPLDVMAAGDGAAPMALPALADSVINLALAFTLGTTVASRPWRRLLGIAPAPREMVHAQVLICVAGALAVVVIGNSLAIAFGLVGLGGFIRFRTGIRDPRDAAVFFLLIGIGMACGLGRAAWGIALTCTVFVSALLFVLDAMGRGKQSTYVRITAQTSDPRGAAGPARQAIESFPVTIRASAIKLQAGQIRFDIENAQGVRPAAIVEKIMDAANGLDSITFEELESLKGSML